MSFQFDYRSKASSESSPDIPLTRQDILLLKAIYTKTGGRNRGVRDVTELETGLTAEEARASWSALLAHDEIERFSVDYAARLSVKGVVTAQTVEIPPEPPKRVPQPKVYIVRGSDNGARETVAEFLGQVNCESIVLDGHTTGGTLMEQAEAHTDVGFAVVLLTAQDLGSLPVLMELGYLVGRLGRGKVSAFAVNYAMDSPVDLAGVALRAFDAPGLWKTALTTDLVAAGFAISGQTI